jgi:hypothetical protein
MVNSSAVCGCCTRTDIVREHLEDTLRICDVSAKGLYVNYSIFILLSPSRRREAPCESTNPPPAIYNRGNESISEV